MLFFSSPTGRWTQEEKLLFLFGLKRFGKGRWKKMSVYLPHRYVRWDAFHLHHISIGIDVEIYSGFCLCRSLVQIKSHAQKVLKRQEAGDDIFRKLEDATPQMIDTMVVQAARERDALRAAGVNVNTTKPAKSLIAAAKKTPKQRSDDNKKIPTKRTAMKNGRRNGSDGNSDSGPESVQTHWDQLEPLDVMPMVDQQANV
jgi:hypothetical protein